MRGWFGKNWGAPICKMTPELPTPKNLLCMRCDRQFKEGDQGIIMPFMADGPSACAYHLDCFMKSVLPPKWWPS